MLRRADSLAPLRVLDDHSTEVVLGTLWQQQTALIALVRHFG